MLKTNWLVAAIAAGWMGAAAAQGAGSGVGGGKDTAGSAGTQTTPRTDMQEGTGTGPNDNPRPQDQSSTTQGTTSSGTMGSSGTMSSDQAASTASGDKATTIAKLHAGHDAEVQAGSWMQQHATNSKVKDFAKKMVNDHSAMDKDLQKYAQKHNLALTGVASVDSEKAKHREALEDLKGMQGAQADHHYMQMMVQDHTKDVSEVKAAAQHAKQGSDKDYSKLLSKTEKKMEDHLKDAQKISHDLASRQARTPASQ
jgi:putative membrane protein